MHFFPLNQSRSSAFRSPAKGRSAGFTLVELLVVLVIITILSAIVLSSLTEGRMRARDTKRVTDIGQLKIALSLYFDQNGSYPAGLSALAPSYIAVVPAPPAYPNFPGITYYYYTPLNVGAGNCNSYHLAAVLENPADSNLQGDANESGGQLGTGCPAGSGAASLPSGTTADFNGGTFVCGGGSGLDTCYDVTP